MAVPTTQIPTKLKPVIDPGRVKKEILSQESRDFIQPGKVLHKKDKDIKSQSPSEETAARFKLNEIIITGATIYRKDQLFTRYIHMKISYMLEPQMVFIMLEIV